MENITELKESAPKETSWHEGGTLHNSTVDEWNNAIYADKLATAADWAMSRPQIENKVKGSGNMDKLRPFANELIKCIDEAVAIKNSGSMSVSELAANCIVVKGW